MTRFSPCEAGPVPSLDKVASGSVCANPKMLSFRDPVSFTAGNLTVCASSWKTVLEGNPKRDELWSYISEGVDVFQFFTPFNGRFQGKAYRGNTPPKAVFPNAASCKGFDSFITRTIKDRASCLPRYTKLLHCGAQVANKIRRNLLPRSKTNVKKCIRLKLRKKIDPESK